jgi:hypothetical protein
MGDDRVIGRAPDFAGAVIDWAPVDAVIEPFEPTSLLALLDAAAVSPTAVHRLPSIVLLWTRVLSTRAAGARSAMALDLPELLAAARSAVTEILWSEDFWPSDPRLKVRFAARGRRLRIHPGNGDRPLPLLTGLEAIAAATDAALVDRYGFGISDLLEVGLQLSETAITDAEPTWSSSKRSTPSALSHEQPEPLKLAAEVLATPATVRQEEVDAARAQLAGRTERALAACANPDRAARALAWTTTDAASLAATITPGEAILGPTLAVEGLLGRIAVPASTVLDGLRAAAEALAATLRDDPTCQGGFVSATADRLATVLGGPAADTASAATEEATVSPEAPTAVVVPGRRHAVVLELVAELDFRRIPDAIAEAAVRLEGWTIEVLRERLGIPVAANAEVIPLVVVADGLAQAIVPRLAGGPIAVSMSDLAAILTDASRDGTGRDEAWQFFDELVRPRTVAEVLTPDLLDAWRHWRRHGGFLPLHVVTEDRHYAVRVPWALDDPSWPVAAESEPIEALLAAAGLPPISNWSAAHLDEPSRATLWMTGEAVACMLGVPHVVVTAFIDPSLRQHGIDPAMPVMLASALRDALTGNPALTRMLGATDQNPLRIHFTIDLTISQELLVAIDTKQRRWRLTAGASFLTTLAADSMEAHAEIGFMLVTAAVGTTHPELAPDDLKEHVQRRNQEFQRHWATSAPLIATRPYHSSLATSAAEPLALPRTRANIVRAMRTIARTLRARGAPPAGRYHGLQAVELIRAQLRPAIDETLHSELAMFDGGALLDELARHLNNAHAARARRRGELQAGLSTPWAAPIRETALAEHDDAWLTLPLELLVEYALADRPRGTRHPDRLDIADLAAVAEQAIYFGVGAEGADRSLHPLSIILLDGGLAAVITRDQHQADADQPLDEALAQRPPHLETPPLDLPAWQRARIADQLRSGNDPSPDDRAVDADQLGRGEAVDQMFTPLVTSNSPATSTGRADARGPRLWHQRDPGRPRNGSQPRGRRARPRAHRPDRATQPSAQLVRGIAGGTRGCGRSAHAPPGRPHRRWAAVLGD